MKIMVFGVPAEKGGALSILSEFYNQFKNDTCNEYIFVVSLPKLEDTSNIVVLRFPWIKKSWIHRLFFDFFLAPKLIRKYKVEKVISLQNLIIPFTEVHQTVYVQNALPFVEHRFSIIESRLLWIHQNILSRGIYKSIKKANKVIVQTNWMKMICVKKLNINPKKIEVLKPKIEIVVKKHFSFSQESKSTFFFPASGLIFKNHKIIIDACVQLKERGITNYSVLFTFKNDENEYVAQLYNQVKKHDLPIKFIGNLSREEVFEYYPKSILIFPSIIETVGLPLIEAKMHCTPIIAADTMFTRETLGDYNKVRYFNPLDTLGLTSLMRERLESEIIQI